MKFKKASGGRMTLIEFYSSLAKGLTLWNEHTKTMIQLNEKGLFILNHDLGPGVYLKTSAMPNIPSEAKQWSLIKE